MSTSSLQTAAAWVTLPQGAVPQGQPAPVWMQGPLSPQVSHRNIHLLWHGHLHGLRVDLCIPVGFHGLQGTASSPWSASQAAEEF